MKNILITIVVLVLLILGYSALRGNDRAATQNAGVTSDGNLSPSQTASSNATDEVKSFTIDAANFAFSMDEIRVKEGDTVRVTLKNTEGFHDFMIDAFAGAKTTRLEAGKEETIEFVADKKGSFEYYCSVGSHRAMGMRGTLIVE